MADAILIQRINAVDTNIDSMVWRSNERSANCCGASVVERCKVVVRVVEGGLFVVVDLVCVVIVVVGVAVFAVVEVEDIVENDDGSLLVVVGFTLDVVVVTVNSCVEVEDGLVVDGIVVADVNVEEVCVSVDVVVVGSSVTVVGGSCVVAVVELVVDSTV